MDENRPSSFASFDKIDVRGWLILAWVLWWSWAYACTAVAHRFPQLALWARSLW